MSLADRLTSGPRAVHLRACAGHHHRPSGGQSGRSLSGAEPGRDSATTTPWPTAARQPCPPTPCRRPTGACGPSAPPPRPTPTPWPTSTTTAQRPFHAVRPLLDADHLLTRTGPRGTPARPGAWYARAGDPIELLARLAPLLRSRWQSADLRWPEPTLVIDTYTASAHLAFDDGELTAVTARRSTVGPSADASHHAAIPPGALLHLTVGHRTLPEVLDARPDAAVRDGRTEQFLTAAFPRVPVRVWPCN